MCGKGYHEPLHWFAGASVPKNRSCTLVLRQARASKVTGPWTIDDGARGSFFTDAISRPCVEGPTIVRGVHGEWLMIFDAYRSDCVLFAPPQPSQKQCDSVGDHPPAAAALQLARSEIERARGRGVCAYEPSRRGFGALRSDDLRSWVDISGEVSAPPDSKHGSALRLPDEAWQKVCARSKAGHRSPFAQACGDRAHGTRA
jgi:hypothetical protein